MTIPDVFAARVFAARYAQLGTLISINADRGKIAGMKMLDDKELPQYWRMKVLLLLVSAIGDWFEREKQRFAIEYLWQKARLMVPEGQNAAADTFLSDLRNGLNELKESQRNSIPDDYEDDLSTALAESAIRDVDNTAEHIQSSAEHQSNKLKGLIKAAEQDLDEDETGPDIPDVDFFSHPDGSCIAEASSDGVSVPELMSGDSSDSASTSDDDQSGTDEENSEDEEDGEGDEDGEDEKADDLAGTLALMNHDGVYTKVPNELRIRVRNEDFNDRSKATYEVQAKKKAKYKFPGLQHRISKRLQAMGHEPQALGAKKLRGRGFRTQRGMVKAKKGKEKKTKEIKPAQPKLLELE